MICSLPNINSNPIQPSLESQITELVCTRHRVYVAHKSPSFASSFKESPQSKPVELLRYSREHRTCWTVISPGAQVPHGRLDGPGCVRPACAHEPGIALGRVSALDARAVTVASDGAALTLRLIHYAALVVERSRRARLRVGPVGTEVTRRTRIVQELERQVHVVGVVVRREVLDRGGRESSLCAVVATVAQARGRLQAWPVAVAAARAPCAFAYVHEADSVAVRSCYGSKGIED